MIIVDVLGVDMLFTPDLLFIFNMVNIKDFFEKILLNFGTTSED